MPGMTNRFGSRSGPIRKGCSKGVMSWPAAARASCTSVMLSPRRVVIPEFDHHRFSPRGQE